MQCRGTPAMPRPIHPVDEEDIGPAVVVIVDKRAARPQRFRQILLAEGTGVVDEPDASGLRNVAKLKPLRGALGSALRLRKCEGRREHDRSDLRSRPHLW